MQMIEIPEKVQALRPAYIKFENHYFGSFALNKTLQIT